MALPSETRRTFDLEPSAPERLELETQPRAQTVASFVLTREAERSWQTLNQHLAEPTGGVFWIGGAPGCGKTHFLNYVIALHSRAGGLDSRNARHLTCGLEIAGRVSAAEVESYLLTALAEQLGADARTGSMWREMRGAGALTVALENAHRTGVRALTVAIDFGTSESAAAADYFPVLAETAANSSAVKLTVIAAGRTPAPPPALPLAVAPADAAEELSVAVRRARRLRADGVRRVASAYSAIENAGFAPEEIFPFHPLTLIALRTLMDPPFVLPALVRATREVLATAPDTVAAGERLIYPADLLATDAIAVRVEARLPGPGRAALKIAHQALGQFQGAERALARDLIDTLVITHLTAGPASLPLGQLQSRVPALAHSGADAAWAVPVVKELLRRLSQHTGGVIHFESETAWFDPGAAGAPEVAAFNAALPLARHFDPALTPARGLADRAPRLRRLADALAAALEGASRTRETLSSALREANLSLPDDHVRTIDGFAALVDSGAAALLETAADPARREAALRIMLAYDALAAAATVVPRMRAMREYLTATGLRAAAQSGPAADPAVAALEAECELLGVELSPRVLTTAPRNLDAVEARFQKFKWTYVQHYRAAHGRWRAEIDRAARIAGDARRYLDALRRLNTIAALGPPEGEGLAARLAALEEQVTKCDPAGLVGPEIAPCCSGCGYLLGAVSPREQLAEVLDLARRALAVKLTALSQSVVARLIRDHDRDRRLEGLLKIIQAAQTDALVRVLDDKLSRYLAQLLEENLAAAGVDGTVRSLNVTAEVEPNRAREERAEKFPALRRKGADRRRD